MFGYKKKETVRTPPSISDGMKATIEKYRGELKAIKRQLEKEKGNFEKIKEDFAQKHADLERLFQEKSGELSAIQQKIHSGTEEWNAQKEAMIKEYEGKLATLNERTENLDREEKQIAKESEKIEARAREVLDISAKFDAQEKKIAASMDELQAEQRKAKSLIGQQESLLEQNKKFRIRIENDYKQIEELSASNRKILADIQSESKWLRQRKNEANVACEKAEIKQAERTSFESMKKDYESRLARFKEDHDVNQQKENELRAWEIVLRNKDKDITRRENILREAEARIR